MSRGVGELEAAVRSLPKCIGFETDKMPLLVYGEITLLVFRLKNAVG